MNYWSFPPAHWYKMSPKWFLQEMELHVYTDVKVKRTYFGRI